jgi:lysophospholipase L1-like esterase
MTCVVLGDSIAVGTGAELRACHTIARVGISSPAYAAAHVLQLDVTLAVISLGSNDGSADTTAALETVRSRVHADRVVWLIPNVGAREHVLAVAARHGDRVVDVRPYVGTDGIHPAYQPIARQVTRGDVP